MKEPQSLLPIGERTFALLMAALSAGIIYEAYQISGLSSVNAPGAFPIGVGIICLLTSLKIIFDAFFGQHTARSGWADAAKQFCAQHFPARTLVFLVLAIAYLFSMLWLSFYISTFVFLVLAIVYLRSGRILNAALIAGILLAIIYLLFTLAFSVYLP